MATRPLTKLSNGALQWETVASEDDGEPLILPNGGAQVAIHVMGTFGGGTLTMQGTIDGTNWFTLKDGPNGSEVTFTAAGYAEVATAVKQIRPSAGASITDVDVKVSVFN